MKNREKEIETRTHNAITVVDKNRIFEFIFLVSSRCRYEDHIG